jgi:hypothetical protein
MEVKVNENFARIRLLQQNAINEQKQKIQLLSTWYY